MTMSCAVVFLVFIGWATHPAVPIGKVVPGLGGDRLDQGQPQSLGLRLQVRGLGQDRGVQRLVRRILLAFPLEPVGRGRREGVKTRAERGKLCPLTSVVPRERRKWGKVKRMKGAACSICRSELKVLEP